MITQSSSIALDLDNASDVDFVIPRTTDLLLQVKRSNSNVRWPGIVAGIFFAAGGVLTMVMTDSLGWHVYIWWGLTLFCFIEEEWTRQKRKQELLVDLLEALVAQNNHFRRELEKLAQSKA